MTYLRALSTDTGTDTEHDMDNDTANNLKKSHNAL